MADFCKTCSIASFGFDSRDLANLLESDQYSDTMGALALCECCGPIVVNAEGERVSKDVFPECDCAQILLRKKEA